MGALGGQANLCHTYLIDSCPSRQAYGVHKADLSAQLSTQLYKHSLVVDLNGMSMGMLRGQKRAVLKVLVLHTGVAFLVACGNRPPAFRRQKPVQSCRGV